MLLGKRLSTHIYCLLFYSYSLTLVDALDTLLVSSLLIIVIIFNLYEISNVILSDLKVQLNN